MNFGPSGVMDERDELNSTGAMAGNRAGVIALRIFLIALIAFFTAVICLLSGAYHGVIDGAPDISDVNIMSAGYATFVYDSDNQEIQKLSSASGNRVSVSISDIPEDMQHAIVAIEDSRFYQHNGVDPRGMMRALIVAIQSGFERTEGASTITQQLLKNNVFTDFTKETRTERIKRKLQEQYLAVELEKSLNEKGENAKEVILENYLNTVNFGAGSYGVQTAARTYLNKDCKDLTLSECAVLAAIPQNPSKYNPKTHPENNATRAHTVLKYMLDQKYITKSEYDEALTDDVYSRIAQNYSDSSDTENVYSYFVDELISQVKTDLMNQKGYTEVQANNAIYSGGLKIYSTQDSRIQAIMDEEFTNDENFPQRSTIALDWALTVDHEDGTRQNYSREMLQQYFRESDSSFDLLFDTQEEAQQAVDQYKAAILQEGDTIVAERTSFIPQPQAAMTVIDQKTGQVKGIEGGRGTKTASLTMNRATDTYRQPGSTFKILSTYGPALNEGEITLATTVEDEPYNYSNGQPVKNADGKYHGTVTIRKAIQNSYNIVAVKILTQITPQKGFDYLEKMGFSKLINSTDWDVIQPLALGGITNGVSNLELTAAYASIANNGVYIEPMFYTKVVDHDGNVLLENSPVTTKVFKDSTAYLLTSAMEDVVSDGTGQQFAFSNMHIAGKTGTTNTYRDLVFAGFTPYYTAAIWAGCDVTTELPQDYRNFHQKLWRDIMEKIHEGLPDQDFTMPSSVEEVKICTKTGLLARSGCPSTTEYFATGTAPTKKCKGHSSSTTYSSNSGNSGSSDSSQNNNTTNADANTENSNTGENTEESTGDDTSTGNTGDGNTEESGTTENTEGETTTDGNTGDTAATGG
ncbi:MAG: transglycosylase domain-containing protein [Bilifractor sp.]|jgi:penicillin-binding protein 1A